MFPSRPTCKLISVCHVINIGATTNNLPVQRTLSILLCNGRPQCGRNLPMAFKRCRWYSR